MPEQVAELRNRVKVEIDHLASDLVAMSEYIHDHPEVGYQEREASRLLSAMLEHEGFDVERELDGIATAFRAQYRCPDPRPVVAFIAEMDALPGIGHACGHNLSGPAAVGAAVAVRRAMKQVGTVQVIATPAEEVPPPLKKRLVERGYFAGIDAVLMVHAADRTAVGGETLAVQALDLRFHGRAAHAAATPDLGISALDAAVLTMHAIEMLREHVRQTTRIHGIVTDGGRAPNVVPDFASLAYLVRSPDSDYLREVVGRVRHCAEGAAHAVGATVEVDSTGTWESRYNVTLLNDLLLRSAVECGADRIRDASERAGSTDFGSVTRAVPGATLKLPVVDEGTPGHSAAYVVASKGDRANECLLIGAKAMALSAVELIGDSSLVSRIHEAFATGPHEPEVHRND